MIENLKKHSGQLANTGVRVAVVFRKLPTDDTHCLIVETERLPDSYHDYLIQTLNSREASETNDFFEVLNRRTFPDGLNCLSALHQRGHLRKEPVSNITMLPLPGHAVPLALINATIDKKLDEYKAGLVKSPEQEIADALAGVKADPSGTARALIAQAEILEKDAAAKREEAYALDPDSKPGRGRPMTPVDLKDAKEEERKNKRRERDRAKAITVKADAKKSILAEKLNAKILRDAARADAARISAARANTVV